MQKFIPAFWVVRTNFIQSIIRIYSIIIILSHYLYGVNSVKYFTDEMYAADFNVDTKNVIFKTTTILSQLNEPPPDSIVLVGNDGSVLSMRYDTSDPKNLETYTGAILNYKNYSVFCNQYSFGCNTDELVGTTQDCNGSSLIVDSMWYNVEYPSPEAAIADNGVFISRHTVLTSGSDNVNFTRFSQYLPQLTEIGSQVEAKAEDCVAFWFPMNVDYYYLYEGLYKSNVSGQSVAQYTKNLTLILPLDKARSISPSQFESFQNIKTNGPPRFDQMSVPVIRYNGKVEGT